MHIIQIAEEVNAEKTYYDNELVALTFSIANLEKFVWCVNNELEIKLAEAEADKADIIRQCADIAHEYNRSGKQAWLDKYGDVRLVDAMMTILKKE
jgi:hypothetical protein